MSAPRPLARPEPPGFGEPAPFFTAETDGVPAYSIQVAAGRWLVLMVFGSLEGAPECEALTAVLARGRLFDDVRAAFFGVSTDPKDRFERGLASMPVGVRYFWDFDQRACAALGVAGQDRPRPMVFLIDPAFRVVMNAPISQVAAVLDRLEQELALERATEPQDQPYAPVLTIPRVFEPELCRLLIDYFEAGSPEPSGFAADIDGRTRQVVDSRLKRRHDVTVEDPGLLVAIEQRLVRRLLPMVKTAFGWQATQIERFLICRYAADDQGFFVAHRDDVTLGSAHRKFAVSINLNAGEYEGGQLRFPEFGRRLYGPPSGGATVFGCSLLHEVTPVTAGMRYVFVPFLFDEAGLRLRRQNMALTDQGEAVRDDS